MKLRHLMSAALGALALSCQGPAAVLAKEATVGGAGASPNAAMTETHQARAFEQALRRLAHEAIRNRMVPAGPSLAAVRARS